MRHTAGRQYRMRAVPVSGLSVLALRLVRDGMAYGARTVQSVRRFGQEIAYLSVENDTADGPQPDTGGAAVRAETCDECHGYRKILYQERIGVEPVADDVASVALELLLGEQGYHRVSNNPLLWLSNAN